MLLANGMVKCIQLVGEVVVLVLHLALKLLILYIIAVQAVSLLAQALHFLASEQLGLAQLFVFYGLLALELDLGVVVARTLHSLIVAGFYVFLTVFNKVLGQLLFTLCALLLFFEALLSILSLRFFKLVDLLELL